MTTSQDTSGMQNLTMHHLTAFQPSSVHYASIQPASIQYPHAGDSIIFLFFQIYFHNKIVAIGVDQGGEILDLHQVLKERRRSQSDTDEVTTTRTVTFLDQGWQVERNLDNHSQQINNTTNRKQSNKQKKMDKERGTGGGTRTRSQRNQRNY